MTALLSTVRLVSKHQHTIYRNSNLVETFHNPAYCCR